MYRRELEMPRDGRGLEMGQDGQGGTGECKAGTESEAWRAQPFLLKSHYLGCVTRAVGATGGCGSAPVTVLLIRLFLDHRRAQALLLRGGWGWQGEGRKGGASQIHVVFE